MIAARRRALAALLTFSATTRIVLADEAPSREPAATTSSAASAPATVPSDLAPQVSSGRRALAVAGSLIPGAFIHGTGHQILGNPRTGSRLFLGQMAGLGILALAAIPVGTLGAQRTVTGPSTALMIGGAGVFLTTWLADVYGVAVPIGERGEPLRLAPLLESKLGFSYVYDPQFDYRTFLVPGFDWRFDRFRVSPEARFAFEDSNARYRLELAYRFLGPMPHMVAEDGSYLDVVVEGQTHSYPHEGFVQSTGGMSFGGRLDLERWDANLRGAFGELSLGFSMVHTLYDTDGFDWNQQLLGRTAFGVYLGHPDSNGAGGEVAVYYDHRHDDYAAGLKMNWLVSGIAGHFGVGGKYYFDEHWGIAGEAEAGSAYVAGMRVTYREGVKPLVGEHDAVEEAR